MIYVMVYNKLQLHFLFIMLNIFLAKNVLAFVTIIIIEIFLRKFSTSGSKFIKHSENPKFSIAFFGMTDFILMSSSVDCLLSVYVPFLFCARGNRIQCCRISALSNAGLCVQIQYRYVLLCLCLDTVVQTGSQTSTQQLLLSGRSNASVLGNLSRSEA